MTIDKRNINLQLNNAKILILEDFLVHKNDVFAESSPHAASWGRHYRSVYSEPSSGYGFSSFPVQTIGVWSLTETAECLDDFETNFSGSHTFPAIACQSFSKMRPHSSKIVSHTFFRF